MNRRFIRALCTGVAIAFLAGCSGWLSPIDAPSATPQSRAVERHADRGKSWMLPEAKSEPLVYANPGTGTTVETYSYPEGKLVGTLTGFSGVASECVDKQGNVWIVNENPPSLIEYAHGGTSPVATLTESDKYIPSACSVDPATGNLAVTNGTGGAVVVFPNASGPPTIYWDLYLAPDGYCSYDGSGNLFVSSVATRELAVLPRGRHRFKKISLGDNEWINSIQWAGTYLAIALAYPAAHQLIVDHVSISGKQGTVVGETRLLDREKRNGNSYPQFWIQGQAIVGPGRNSLNYWHYPKGGQPFKVIKHDRERFFGAVMSVPTNLPRPGFRLLHALLGAASD